uniref:Uncharacterized protein n=1 Tax=Vespula pensylvanica TaxID=30213 RepID=A0A834NX67_VESPE|nr:hypothetical protein H0235_010564 [Vespula pensylvanica]
MSLREYTVSQTCQLQGTRGNPHEILKFQDKILKGYTHSNGTHGASEIPQEVLETRKRKKRVTGYTATCTAEPDIALTIVQSRGRHHPWLP